MSMADSKDLTVSQVIIKIDTSQADAKVRELMQFFQKKRKYIRRIMAGPIANAKKKVQVAARGAMRSDPRQAYKAVRGYVWKRGDIGMSVSIMDGKKRGGKTYSRVRKIHRPIKERTLQIDSYMGADRGFVLRALDQGHGNIVTKLKTGGVGKLPMLPAKRFFARAAEPAVSEAAEEVARRISILIKEVSEGKK
jgi:hypothetical protein